jgi:ribonuclease HI
VSAGGPAAIESGQHGHLVLRTDGASRGNPGPAAAGVVIEDETGQVIARGKRFLGHMTNNQAEYRALILGLRAVGQYRPSAVTVYMDSELVINQMAGRYQVRDAQLRPLYDEAQGEARKLREVRFVHVRRSMNRLADKLANEALDAQGQKKAD